MVLNGRPPFSYLSSRRDGFRHFCIVDEKKLAISRSRIKCFLSILIWRTLADNAREITYAYVYVCVCVLVYIIYNKFTTR